MYKALVYSELSHIATLKRRYVNDMRFARVGPLVACQKPKSGHRPKGSLADIPRKRPLTVSEYIYIYSLVELLPGIGIHGNPSKQPPPSYSPPLSRDQYLVGGVWTGMARTCDHGRGSWDQSTLVQRFTHGCAKLYFNPLPILIGTGCK